MSILGKLMDSMRLNDTDDDDYYLDDDYEDESDKPAKRNLFSKKSEEDYYEEEDDFEQMPRFLSWLERQLSSIWKASIQKSPRESLTLPQVPLTP